MKYLILSVLVLPILALAGTETSSGAEESLEAHFMRVASKSAHLLIDHYITRVDGKQISHEKLNSLFIQPTSDADKVHVVVISQPQMIDGGEKSAIARGNTVTLYKPDWENVTDPNEFRSLVLHELMRLINLPDDDYQASEHLERALEGIDAFADLDIQTLRIYAMPPSGAGGTGCEGVTVHCGPWHYDNVGIDGVIAMLKPNTSYYGKCGDVILWCDY